MKLNRSLLAGGIAMPAVYLLNLMTGVLLDPGYNLMAQLPSDLGGPEATRPGLFNAGLMAVGALGGAGAIGVGLGLRRLGSGSVLSGLSALAMLAPSIGFLMAGLFPLPNPLHHAFNMSLGGFLIAPLATIVFLRKPRSGPLAIAFALAFVIAPAVLVVGQSLATKATGGAWTLGIGLIALMVFEGLCLAVWRRLPA